MSDTPQEPTPTPASEVKVWLPFDVITLIDEAILAALRSRDAAARDHMAIAKSIYTTLDAKGLIQHHEQGI